MIRARTILLFAALSPMLSLAGCAGNASDDSDLDSIELSLSKDDSLRNPTYFEELQLFRPETRTLTAKSGFHAYTFEAMRAGQSVKIVLKSGSFRTYLRVVAPDGRRWSISGTQDANNNAWYSVLDTAMPQKGKYTVYATSVANLRHGSGSASGEYTLSADSDVRCAGIADFQCPVYLKCILDGSFPDAGGHCQPVDACAVPSDCNNLIRHECMADGAWECLSDSKTGYGTCSFQCNP